MKHIRCELDQKESNAIFNQKIKVVSFGKLINYLQMKYFTNSSFGLFVSNLSAFLFCLSGLSLCASPFPCHSFPHTPTPIFSPEYITFHTLKTSAHYIACELPELFDGSGAECNHLHPVHQGMAVFLFGKIGLG